MLNELCLKKPASKTEVRSIRGFGEKKTELYASPILEIIDKFRSVSA